MCRKTADLRFLSLPLTRAYVAAKITNELMEYLLFEGREVVLTGEENKSTLGNSTQGTSFGLFRVNLLTELKEGKR